MLKKFLILTLFVAHFPHKGEAIRCYQCISSGGSKPECDDGSTYEGRERQCVARSMYASGYQPYQYQPSSGHIYESPASYCIKASGYSNGVFVTIRSCSREYLEQRDEFTFDGYRFHSGYLVSCNSELCNASTRYKPSYIMLPVLLLYRMFI